MEKKIQRGENRTKKNKKSKQISSEFWDTILNEDKKINCIYEKNNINQKDDIIKTQTCTECNDRLFYNPEGLLFCGNKNCGILYKDLLDFTAEWRYYGADDNNISDPTRCGMPINPLLIESSYGCKVACNKSSSYEMRKIKRYIEWQSMPYKEKSRYDDFQIITLIGKNSNIPKIIIDDAIRYYDKLINAKTFRGLNRDGILAASIYISFNVNKNPRTPKEIATIFNLDNTSATKGCKNAINILNDLETDNNLDDKTIFVKTKPSDFINRYCSKLNINQELTSVCIFVANIVESKKLIPENTPHSIAAGIIYFISLVCNLNINKKDINKVSSISEVTINKCSNKLDKYKNILVPPVIINKYTI